MSLGMRDAGVRDAGCEMRERGRDETRLGGQQQQQKQQQRIVN